MPAPECALWREYHQRHGFEVDRICWTIAKVGAAVCPGASPGSFIPRFVVQRGMDLSGLRAGLMALGGKVEKVAATEMARRFKASRTV